MLQSVGDPGYVNCVFVRDLDPATVVIREGRIREVVIRNNGCGRRCGERGCRCGLGGGEAEALEESEDEGGGGEEVVEGGHGGDV